MALVFLSTQPIFKNGALAYGAKIRAYDAGTTTPRPLFLTSALDPTRQHPDPVPVGADGCAPVMHTGVGDYDLAVFDKDGAQFRFIAGLPGDPAPQDSAGDAFDPLRQLPTGALVTMATTGRRDGYVRANGLTIGSGTSDASERAAADTRPLYVLLWANANAVVNGGKGASAGADFDAGKTLRLPDFQNRAVVGVTDMGNAGSAASLAGSGVGSIAVGSTGGEAAHVLGLGEMPAHQHAATFAGDVVLNHTHSAATEAAGGHRHNVSAPATRAGLASGANLNQYWYGSGGTDVTSDVDPHTHSVTMQGAGGHTPSGSITMNDAGSGSAHNNLQPFAGAMVYLKL